MADPIILYFNGTFINRQNGAHARMLELLNFAVGTGRRVIVYSYIDHRACPWGAAEIDRFHSTYPDVELVLDERGRLFRLITLLKIRLIALFPQLAARLIPLRLKGLTPAYERLRQTHPDAPMIVNYAHGLAELNGVDPGAVIIETHDINFLNAAKSLHRPLTAPKTMLSARMELELLGRAAALIAIAPPEAGMFRLFFPDKPIYLVPAYRMPAPTTAGHDFEYDILFVGSENVLNVDGLCAFIAEHREWLRSRTMAVVGRVCLVDRVRDAVAGLRGIELLGYVEDLAGLMRRCKLLVSPVDGTGLKIKVLEGLAAGLPVFGSVGTLEGLPKGYEDCAFRIDEAAMQRLIDDEPTRRRAEEAALRYSQQLIANDDLGRLRAYLLESMPASAA